MALGVRDRIKQYGNNPFKSRTPGDYIFPALGFFIFVMLTWFVYVPIIFTDDDSFMNLRTQRQEVEADMELLDEKIADIEAISSDRSKINADLSVARTIIPTALDVSDFSYYVDRLAQSNDLEFIQLSSGDSSVQSVGTAGGSISNNVFEVSGPITYEGNYLDILDFLDQLQTASPYVVEVQNIDLKKNSVLLEEAEESGDELQGVESNLWRVEVLLSGYYISNPEGDISINPYSPFVPYTNYADVLEIFEAKEQAIIDTE